jgi:hypothetical protein
MLTYWNDGMLQSHPFSLKKKVAVTIMEMYYLSPLWSLYTEHNQDGLSPQDFRRQLVLVQIIWAISKMGVLSSIEIISLFYLFHRHSAPLPQNILNHPKVSWEQVSDYDPTGSTVNAERDSCFKLCHTHCINFLGHRSRMYYCKFPCKFMANI